MPHSVTFRAISGFRLVTADPLRLITFYQALGFEIQTPTHIPAAEMRLLQLEGTGSRTAMSLGGSIVELDEYARPGHPYPRDATASDLIFQHLALVTDNAHKAWRRARDAGAVPITQGEPVTLPPSSGNVTAIKFRDPDGHPLEFLQFARGTNPKWKGSGILGVDHSAISVSDVAVSRRFYSDHGLKEGNATINEGPTQDALDGLDNVLVDVVPMNPATKTPHLEMLGYRHPTGRAANFAANDIAATRIVWRSDRDELLRDPDGHLHQLSR